MEKRISNGPEAAQDRDREIGELASW